MIVTSDMSKETTRDTLLAIATRDLCRGGYGAVSFRKLAAEIGIKSASVHHYFPTKGDLVLEVLAQYSEQVFEDLGPPDAAGETPRDRLSRMTDSYLARFEVAQANDLCAALGAAPDALPDAARQEVARHNARVTAWVRVAAGPASKMPASLVIALMQGALGQALVLGQPEPLQEAEALVLSSL